MSSLILNPEREPLECASQNAGEFGSDYPRDTPFEQLLRLAASYAISQTAAGQGQSRSALRKSPITEDIELRAYQIYLGRGGVHGQDFEDWLLAERQILEELKKNKASLRLALAFGVLREP
jgi:hypothetical protein